MKTSLTTSFLERQGRFTLTPLYDVVSAYPVLGHGRGMIPKQQLKMAMAVRHYAWDRVQKRHWLEQARTTGSSLLMDECINEILQEVSRAIREVTAKLPQGFPEEIASPIFAGIQENAKRLQ
ncbi:MAG TPA: hypothetical protein VJ869_01725 [Sphaerochaeta sp.]|nr:hypothetical protein [Sphaerochaeta sp.]